MKYAAMGFGMERVEGVLLTDLEMLEELAKLFPDDVELSGGVYYILGLNDCLIVWDDDRVWAT